MKIREFDKATCEKVGAAVEAALKTIAANFNVTLEMQGGKYDTMKFSPKFEFQVKETKSGKTVGEENVTQFAKLYGVNVKFGQVFDNLGTKFTVVDVKARRSKYPIIAMSEHGKRFKFPIAAVDKKYRVF